MGTAKGYCRVSTIYQRDNGISMENQRNKIRLYCEFKGYNLSKIYEDVAVSGSDTNRPSLQLLLSETSKGDYIIISDLSRLSRSTFDALDILAQFDKIGANLVCLSPELDLSSAFGRMIFTVLMAFYNLERETISMNVSENMKYLSSQGRLRSRACFGYKYIGKDKDLIEEPSQQQVLKEILVMHAEGMKLAQIANKLNEQGKNVTLLNNKKTIPDKTPIFHAQTIKRILIDQNILIPTKPIKRPPLEQRIVSHHKSNDVQAISSKLSQVSIN